MEKLSMGEYTEVVWAAYAVAAVILLGVAFSTVRSLRQAQKKSQELSE